MENIVIKRVQATKFLGVFIDQHLSWKHHTMQPKRSQNLLALHANLVFSFLQNQRRHYIITQYSPSTVVCNIAWSLTYPTHLNRVFLLQKRIVRIIARAEYLAPTATLSRKLKVPDIFGINTFLIASFMSVYSWHNQLLLNAFTNLFSTSQQIHIYITRYATNYRPHHCTNIKQFTILYQGHPKIWNSLPRNLTLSSSIACLKMFT